MPYKTKFLDVLVGAWERLLLPNHHNKMTRTVVAAGVAVLLDGYFLNGLLGQLALRLASKFLGVGPFEGVVLPTSGGAHLGFWLVLAGLSYSFLVYALGLVFGRSTRAAADQASSNTLKRDAELYTKFRDVFGSGVPLSKFLADHHFGSSWPANRTSELDAFIVEWAAPEREFQNAELRDSFWQFYDKTKSLFDVICAESGRVSHKSNRDCIFDSHLHSEFDMPEHVSGAIAKANELSWEANSLREAFIRSAEAKFASISAEAAV